MSVGGCFIFLSLFWLQNKLSAITENRKQQLGKKEKKIKRYAKKMFKWKVFSDNRMANQGNQLFCDYISFYGESE